MSRFWVSWYAPKAEFVQFEWHGPWWISGEDFADRYTVCAAVSAVSEVAARRAIVAAYDTPRELEFRFVSNRPDDWEPYTDRFPHADWMTWPWTAEQNTRARTKTLA